MTVAKKRKKAILTCTSNIESFSWVIVMSENVDSRWCKSVYEQGTAREDKWLVFFQLPESAKIKILIRVVQISQIINRVVVILHSVK